MSRLVAGGTFAPLRHRSFRLLWSGQVVSNLGDWLDYLALAVLIAYVWHKGATSLAGLAVVIAAPWLFVAPFAGVLADRWPKRAVLITCDLTRAALVVGFVFAPNLAVLLPLVGLKAVVSTFFSPAEQATIRLTVPSEQLGPASALSQLALQSTKVLGPALGGLIVSVASPRAAFAADAATFVVSAAILSRLAKIPAVVGDADGEGSFWRELQEGIAYIVSRRALWMAIVSFAAAVFLLFTFDALSPLVLHKLSVSRSLFGVSVACVGLGGVLGALGVGRLVDRWNLFVLMGLSKVLIGALVALIGVAAMVGLDAPPVVWAPVLLGVGIASAGVLVAAPTIIQLETPPALIGRVSTSAGALPTVLQLFAPLIGAAVAKAAGIGFVFAAAGAGLVALGTVVVLVRPAVGIGVEGAGAAESLGSASASGGAEPPVDPLSTDATYVAATKGATA